MTYLVFALTDAAAALMLMGILRRLKFPLWVIGVGGLLFALYVPAIVGTAAVLQQPLIRFALMLALWAYSGALTDKRQRAIWLWALLGIIGSLLLGLSSFSTRPLMWAIPILVLLLGWRSRALRSAQLTLIALLALSIVGILSVLAFTRPGFDAGALILPVAFGLSSGAHSSQTTVLTFPHLWAHDDWLTYGLLFPERVALGEAFAADPVEFMRLWLVSLAGNWRYPDYAYFQVYLLDLYQQQVQHWLFLIGGVVGLVWLLAQRGERQRHGVLMAAVIAGTSLIYSVISIEPRRLTVLSPLLALLGSVGLWVLWNVLRSAWTLRPWREAVIVSFTLILYLLPPSSVLAVLDVPPLAVHIGLVALRTALTAVSALLLLRRWRQANPGVDLIWPGLALAALGLVLVVAALDDREWRTWTTSLSAGESARQTVTQWQTQPHLHPWLIFELQAETPDARYEIYANGERVQAADDPIYTWEAGFPPRWDPYTLVAEMGSISPPRNAWTAFPLPAGIAAGDEVEIELRVTAGTVRLWGDYADRPDFYTGPSHSPWADGRSFWRWQWNALDPRIPVDMPLPGSHVSAVWREGTWQTDDLSVSAGRQAGHLRLFPVQVAFGLPTNALVDLSLPPDAVLDPLLENALAAEDDWRESPMLQDRLVSSTPLPDGGHLDLIQVFNKLAVVNLYGPDGQLLRSLTLRSG